MPGLVNSEVILASAAVDGEVLVRWREDSARLEGSLADVRVDDRGQDATPGCTTLASFAPPTSPPPGSSQ
jgi:hypothetical protein